MKLFENLVQLTYSGANWPYLDEGNDKTLASESKESTTDMRNHIAVTDVFALF